MTFARTVKEELVHLKTNKSEKLAELSALLHLGSEVVINNKGLFIVFRSTNIALTRHFFKLIKKLYNAEMEIATSRTSFKTIELSVLVKTQTQNIASETSLIYESLSDYELLTIERPCKQAYLRGAFLASGSINNPIKPNYHLEIFAKSKTNAIFTQRLMNHFNLNAKIAKRRNGLIVYLKEAEAISEFLKVVNAYESVFHFEDLRIHRDFNNSINRLINIEIANEKKTLKAANQQLKQIKLIKQYKIFDMLEPSLKQIIALREENPTASLNELSLAYEEKTGEKISKSGINHRLQKIKELSIEIIKTIKEQEKQQ